MTKARLRILETTDLHMQLLGFNYLTRNASDAVGLTNLAPMIAQARSEAELTLLFDNGDFLQGTPLAEQLVAHHPPEQEHPVITAMHLLDYDAITLGNHEFDYGLDYLEAVLAKARMPIVCANLRRNPQETMFPAWTVLHRKIACDDGTIRDLRIGVIGFVTPQIVDWDAHLLQGRVSTDDIVAAARTYLPQLRRAGVDVTVALCHSGISGVPHHDRMENAALPLAALPGIDVVLSGHTHDTFPSRIFHGVAGADCARGTLHGKPAVMAGAYGSHLGVIDLDLAFDADGWTIADHKVALRKTATANHGNSDPVARDIMAALDGPHEATMTSLAAPVTVTPRRLTSYLATLGYDDTAPLMAAAMTAQAREMVKEHGLADLPVLAATASFRAGGHGGAGNFIDMPRGDVTTGDIAAIAPFNNPVCAMLLHGWRIRQWLETTSAYFATVTDPTVSQPLTNPQVPSYHFDTLYGLRYRIDLRVPPRTTAQNALTHRVRDVTLEGVPLEDDAPVLVATSSYRAFGGGGQFNGTANDVVATSDQGMMQILEAHLARHGVPKDRPPVPWRIVPFASAPLTFDSAASAREVLDTYDTPYRISPGKRRNDGFQTFALQL